MENKETNLSHPLILNPWVTPMAIKRSRSYALLGHFGSQLMF